jgi:nuclear transport factor 2 (NTF2) superfamily protein
MDAHEWVASLESAWRGRDPASIAGLFSEDAWYRQGPFGAPHVGRPAIEAHWTATLGRQRDPRIWIGAPVVADDRAALEWWCILHDPETGAARTAAGSAMLWFARDGLCRGLQEYWHGTPGAALEPHEHWPHRRSGDSVLSWRVADRGFTPEQIKAVESVLSNDVGGPDRVELALLGGSFAAGLGTDTSDVDLYVVGPDLPPTGVIFTDGGGEVHVNAISPAKLRKLIALGTAYRVTGADRAQIADETALNHLVRLTVTRPVHVSEEWRELLGTIDLSAVRQLLMTRHANLFATYAEDVSGALASGDLFTAVAASGIALAEACEAVLSAAGDLYTGPKFLFRRLARNAVTAPWCDHLWRLAHPGVHPESGSWPGEVRALAEDRLWAGGLLLASCAVEGWDKPLDLLPPVPARPDAAGPRRNRYFTPLRFADGLALAGPGGGYEVTEHTLRLWRQLDGRPLAETPRDDLGEIEAAVARLARFGVVEGHPADGPEPGRFVIQPAPRVGVYPREES